MTEHDMDWDRLRVFLAVTEAGSFTRAGRALSLSQSAVSRQMIALEEELGASLFHRHARGLVLTEPGEDFHHAVRDMAEKLALARERINEARERPEGPLRITTTVAFGTAWLTARMNKFLALYPDISVSLLLIDSEELDLSLGQAEVAIRFARQTQPSLIQRPLMSIRYHVFASKDYLAAHGTPETAKDLDAHALIVYGDEVPAPIAEINWLLEAGAEPDAPRDPALRVNNVYGIYRAVRSGLGVGALPYYMSNEAPDLVEVLPDLKGPSFAVYFVYPEELRHSKRIAVVRDFLLQEIAQDTGRDDAPRGRQNSA
jgi:DNA-binding transcriptional LysR family regulator